METTSVTIELPKAEAMFLKEYTVRHKITISQLIDYLIEQLQQAEEYVLHPEIHEILGIIPDDLDAKEVYYQHIQEKHR